MPKNITNNLMIKNNSITILLNPKIYPLDVIYATCYAFIDRAYLYLDGNPEKEIRVTIKTKNKISREKINATVGEFQNELLNQALRAKIVKNNKKIREYIMAKALFSANPDVISEAKKSDIGNPKIKGDFKNDSLGIAIPWGEKREKIKRKNVKK